MPNENIETLIQWAIGDFKSAWDGIASLERDDYPQRGNFLFARQAMTLLELTCRVCNKNKLMKSFSKNLQNIESRYFIEMPNQCYQPGDFSLPKISGAGNNSLISLLFDLIRNGQSHQYQQIHLVLKDKVTVMISLTGPDVGQTLQKTQLNRRNHLETTFEKKDLIKMKVRPDILFSDFHMALARTKRPKNIKYKYLSRNSKTKKQPCFSFKFCRKKNTYDFDSVQLVNALRSGGINI